MVVALYYIGHRSVGYRNFEYKLADTHKGSCDGDGQYLIHHLVFWGANSELGSYPYDTFQNWIPPLRTPIHRDPQKTT